MDECMKPLTMNTGKIDTHMNVYINMLCVTGKSTGLMNKTSKRKIGESKGTFSGARIDTPDAVF